MDAHVVLAAAYGAQAREQEAKRDKHETLRLEPDFKLKKWVPRLFPFKDPAHLERVMTLLSKAGLPE